MAFLVLLVYYDISIAGILSEIRINSQLIAGDRE